MVKLASQKASTPETLREIFTNVESV